MSAGPQGTLLAGLDEAGLGPLLGPLTIGFAVLRVPGPASDPWELLAKRVTREPGDRSGRVVVADSKKVFTRNPRGRKRLEETALSFAALLREDGEAPTDAAELLFGPLRPAPELLARHPWYAALPALPREHGADKLRLSASLLRRELERTGAALVDLGVRLVPAGELNGSYRETNNKADTVWAKTLEVLQRFWRVHGHEHPQVTIDLQGGRAHYGPPLARAFPDASVRLLHEGPGEASYELTERRSAGLVTPERSAVFHFRAKGEEHSFVVALASCMAKYARECAMDAFNAYFAAHQPALRPTAGYTTDGRRWLAEAGPALRACDVPREMLVRER